MVRAFLYSVVAVSLAACSGAGGGAAPTAADSAAINQVRDAEIAGLTSGDTVLAGYTDDVVVMPPNEPAQRGKAEARAWARNMYSMVRMEGSYTGSELTFAGDYAIERYTGRVTVTPVAGGDAMTETFKGVHVYRRQADGSWLIAFDIWNSNEAPPAPPAPAAAPRR